MQMTYGIAERAADLIKAQVRPRLPKCEPDALADI